MVFFPAWMFQIANLSPASSITFFAGSFSHLLSLCGPGLDSYPSFNGPIRNTDIYTLKQAAAAAAKSLQSCLTLCDPIDGSPPGSAVPGILQARTLEWAAIAFSNAWKRKVKVKLLSRVWLLATPRTAAHPAPPSMGFSMDGGKSTTTYKNHNWWGPTVLHRELYPPLCSELQKMGSVYAYNWCTSLNCRR